jgi:hypothetical protein
VAIDADERSKEKRQKFVRLANNRVNRAIRELRLVGNLSNRAAYAYTQDDAKKIIKALQREVDTLRSRYLGTPGGGDSEFSLEP